MRETLTSTMLSDEPQAPMGKHSWPRRGLPRRVHRLIFSSVAVPVAALVALFSVAGWGDVTYLALVSLKWPWYTPFGIAAAFATLLWALDAQRWRRPVLVYGSAVLLTVLLAVGCSLATTIFPFAPLQFSLLVIPSCAFVTRRWFLGRCSAWRYFRSLSQSTLIVAAALLAYFLLWVFVLPPPASRLASGWEPTWVNVWDGPVKRYWRRRLQCEAPDATVTEADDSACFDAAFLWWFYPLLLVLVLLLTSAACRLLSRTLERGSSADLAAETFAVKAFLAAMALAVCGFYAAASIAGAGMGLNDVVVSSSIMLLGVAVAVVGSTVGWTRLTKALVAMPWVQRALAFAETVHEWSLATGMLVGALPFLGYVALSAANQLCRRALPCTHTASGGSAWLTAEALARLAHLGDVHWGSVLSKVLMLGVAYMCMSVLVSKVWAHVCMRVAYICMARRGMHGHGLLVHGCPCLQGTGLYVHTRGMHAHVSPRLQ